jgi:mRNA interferase MazF
MIIPERWHIYTVDLEPRVGTKPGKQRPCLCVQPTEFCENGIRSALIIPLTTNVRPEDRFPIRVRIPQGTCNLQKDSEAMIEQILAWDLSNFKTDLGEIPVGLQEIIKAALRSFLDL